MKTRSLHIGSEVRATKRYHRRMAQGGGGGANSTDVDNIVDADVVDTPGHRQRDPGQVHDSYHGARGGSPTSEVPSAGDPSSPPDAVTRGMKLGLDIAALIAVFGMVLQLLMLLWLGVAVLIVVSAGTALLRAGIFDPDIFAVCAVRAALTDAGLLLAGAWLARPSASRSLRISGPYVRYPVTLTALGLLAGLGGVTAFGWSGSTEFAQVATTIILANAYFFALLAVAWTLRSTVAVWVALRSWARASAYRMGAMTISLALVGILGVGLLWVRWYAIGALEVNQEVQLAPILTAEGIIDAQLAGLCIASEEVAKRSEALQLAPACTTVLQAGAVTPEVSDSDDICFASLQPQWSRSRAQLRKALNVNSYDADDIAMHALLVTCTKDPAPDDRATYFHAAAQRQGQRHVRPGRRHMGCDQPIEAQLTTCAPTDPPELREARLSWIWDDVLCQLDDHTATIVHARLVDDMSYRDIGERLRIHETEAKDAFHSAIKRLRQAKRRFQSCLPE